MAESVTAPDAAKSYARTSDVLNLVTACPTQLRPPAVVPPGRLGFPIGLLADGLSPPIHELVVEYESPLELLVEILLRMERRRNRITHKTIKYFVPEVDIAPAPVVEGVFETPVFVVFDVPLETVVDSVVAIATELVVVDELSTRVVPVVVPGTH